MLNVGETHCAKAVLLLLCIDSRTKMVSSTVKIAKLYQPMENRHFLGELNTEDTSKGQIIQSCAISCLVNRGTSCKGFVFSSDQPIFSRCMHIVDSITSTDLTSPLWNGYELYYLARISPMVQWKSPKPRLYFPLDYDTGTRHGPDPQNVAFIGGGIVGNAFYNPIGGGSKSYYRLAHYNSSQYCFPVPTSCPLGVTFSFWVNILNETGDVQGLLTTKPTDGQGLVIRWKNDQGFRTFIQRDLDNKEEILKIDPQTFLDNYGYGSWVHYVLAYRFNGSSLGNNMDVYLNGIARPDSEKRVTAWSGTTGHDGGLELGHAHLGKSAGYASVLMDEIIIWEEMLTPEKIVLLYEAY